jgi:hypothetical protein
MNDHREPIPAWEEYKKQSGIVIPWALFNGQAWRDLFGKPLPAESGP